MTTEELSKLMAVIATEYPRNFDVSAERMKIWIHILEGIDYPEGMEAVIAFLREARPFPPVVGEVYQKALEIRAHKAFQAEQRRKRHLMLEQTKEQKALPAPTPEEVQANKEFVRGLVDNCIKGIREKAAAK